MGSQEAIARIALLYAVEDKACGMAPAERVALRQAEAKPVFDDLERWLHDQLPKLSGKSTLAGAIRYALDRMKKARPYLDNGFLEIDNNTAERAVKPVALGRKNWTSAGSEGGGKAMAIAHTLIETAKLNKVDPQAWLIPAEKLNDPFVHPSAWRVSVRCGRSGADALAC